MAPLPNLISDAIVFPKDPRLSGAASVQPFPYQGSKRGLTSAILPLLGDCDRLIEPFAGSAAVSLASRLVGQSATGVIADVNEPLMKLWGAIVETPEALSDGYQRLWEAQREDPREFFRQVRDRFNTTHEPVDFLYLLNRIVKGALRYGRDGQMNQGADNRRLGAKPETVRRRIIGASQLMRGTEIVTAPYEEVLSRVQPDTDVVYMDPPYQGTSTSADHRYIANLQREDFEQELGKLVARNVKFLVSYDVVTEDALYGQPLSEELGLVHIHVTAGASAQATLLGRRLTSVESLYLSPALVESVDLSVLRPQTLF